MAVLASGDPFWFGAGSTLARHLDAGEWQAFAAPSTFSQVASRLGWALDQTICLGLHAAPLSRLRPHLAEDARILILLRDGAAVSELAQFVLDVGFKTSQLMVFEAIGGPRERVRALTLDEARNEAFAHPVCAALDVSGDGITVPLASGRPDALFDHDGQITKRPIRALTLSALSPKPGEHLWDIGGGSGSIAIEWLLAHPSMQATSIEAAEDRAARIESNAMKLGVDRLRVIQGRAPAALDALENPDAVFIGGGISDELLLALTRLRAGTRLVANAVTLEAEALLTDAQVKHGGALMRIGIAQAEPLGSKRGWKAGYPIVQWSVTL